jgi:hypothetical protein
MTASPARNPKIKYKFIFLAKILRDKTAIRINDVPMVVIIGIGELFFMKNKLHSV